MPVHIRHSDRGALMSLCPASRTHPGGHPRHYSYQETTTWPNAFAACHSNAPSGRGDRDRGSAWRGDGFDAKTVRIVGENSATLKFSTADFEEAQSFERSGQPVASMFWGSRRSSSNGPRYRSSAWA